MGWRGGARFRGTRVWPRLTVRGLSRVGGIPGRWGCRLPRLKDSGLVPHRSRLELQGDRMKGPRRHEGRSFRPNGAGGFAWGAFPGFRPPRRTAADFIGGYFRPSLREEKRHLTGRSESEAVPSTIVIHAIALAGTGRCGYVMLVEPCQTLKTSFPERRVQE
jgi:hypothetical protein